MPKPPFSQHHYTYHSKYIGNALSLRRPQGESLEIFARLCDILSLSKEPDLESELAAVRAHFPSLQSFERSFPSFCFSLATGVGKTRLMGAMIAYLRYEKGIRNFLVMAPNLTIYKKLREDLGNPSNPKYVFRGLDKFSKPPLIIDGDNYQDINQGNFLRGDVTINVFNISKLNADSKAEGGAPARIKRFREVLGRSYFAYLQSLKDLCIFMDESHHYHADRSFEVINELNPILGVELTATPIVRSSGARRTPVYFKNIIYEYTLAHALREEQYVKEPWVFTRKNFDPTQYMERGADENQLSQLDIEKLTDGLRLHEGTRAELEIYARNSGKPLVRPFVLVVAQNTAHSALLKQYISSPSFFQGYYADKVMEINSSQRGAEKDANVEALLALEKPENKIEIVIHVNMLKEGWDVTNLYTLVPLRASAAEILTEQTLGRGLRLPYGRRTGVEAVDRLSIVSHDKYRQLVELSRDAASIIRRVSYIEDDAVASGGGKEIIELTSSYDDALNTPEVTDLFASLLPEVTPAADAGDEGQGAPTAPSREAVASFIVSQASATVADAGKLITGGMAALKDADTQSTLVKLVVSSTHKQFPAYSKEELEQVAQKAVQTCTQMLTDKIIPIPRAVVQPAGEQPCGFRSFILDTRNMHFYPADNALIGQELGSDGKPITIDADDRHAHSRDGIEKEIVKSIIRHDNVDYGECADLIYSLLEDAKRHFASYLNEADAVRVMRMHKERIANLIYEQMNEHFYCGECVYEVSRMLPFVKIETEFVGKITSESIRHFRETVTQASAIRGMIFNGYSKSCHTLLKFHSCPEKDFSCVLEDDPTVLRWLRPASRQFEIYYGTASQSRYEPDFVVETASTIYMVEVKSRRDVENDPTVWQKADAGQLFCQSATTYNRKSGGKPWEYALIADDRILLNSSFDYLIAHRERRVRQPELFD